MPDPIGSRQLFAAKIAFLQRHGAHRSAHLHSSLLRHLLATYELLHAWGARRALCNAGLFHSVYGTETYQHASVPLELREQVRDLIGDEAEALVYLFGIMVRESLYENLDRSTGFCVRSRLDGAALELSKSQLVDLYHLAVANWLEQHLRFPPAQRYARREQLFLVRPYLGERARAALDIAYDFDTDRRPSGDAGA